MGYVYLCIAITAEVIATTSLKSSDGFTKAPQTALVIIGYAVAFYFLSLTLKYMSTGVAYAIWSGIGTVMITLAAWIWHGQRLDTAAITGIAMIIAGVIVMNLLSSTHS